MPKSTPIASLAGWHTVWQLNMKWRSGTMKLFQSQGSPSKNIYFSVIFFFSLSVHCKSFFNCSVATSLSNWMAESRHGWAISYLNLRARMDGKQGVTAGCVCLQQVTPAAGMWQQWLEHLLAAHPATSYTAEPSVPLPLGTAEHLRERMFYLGNDFPSHVLHVHAHTEPSRRHLGTANAASPLTIVQMPSARERTLLSGIAAWSLWEAPLVVNARLMGHNSHTAELQPTII